MEHLEYVKKEERKERKEKKRKKERMGDHRDRDQGELWMMLDLWDNYDEELLERFSLEMVVPNYKKEGMILFHSPIHSSTSFTHSSHYYY